MTLPNYFLETYYPENIEQGKDFSAIIFFFGGGWKGGDRKHFINQAKFFSKRGLLSILADYRTENLNKTTPFESLKDDKSAIRFIKINPSSFQVNISNLIIASGGSPCGHLAAETALIKDYNEVSESLSDEYTTDALVLFNPVIDNCPSGFGYERIGSEYNNFSPLHNINKGAPSTLKLIGTEDALIPVETVKYYKKY